MTQKLDIELILFKLKGEDINRLKGSIKKDLLS